jgi:hypothetical protein
VIRLKDRRNMCFQLLLHTACVCLDSLDVLRCIDFVLSQAGQTASLQGSASELELGK